MTIEEWQTGLERAIVTKLAEVKPDQELAALDVGVFPWHSTIELSALYKGDSNREDCFEDEVASWPQYNFSKQQEGDWPAIESLTQTMDEAYRADPSSKEVYFAAAGRAAKSQLVAARLEQLSLSEEFRMIVVDPDDPGKQYG